MSPTSNDTAPTTEPVVRARVPSLDGLRAIAIILVILNHLGVNTKIVRWAPRNWAWVLMNGTFGVAIFFAISGFIISLLLFEEKAGTGAIRVGRFYLRRTLRIVPPFYFYVACVAVLRLCIGPFQPWDFLSALSLTWNYTRPIGSFTWDFGHTWSLAVEEQFYLFWPLLVIFCTRQTLIRVAAVVVVLQPAIRWLGDLSPAIAERPAACFFHNRMDAFLLGAIAAHIYLERGSWVAWMRTRVAGFAAAAVAVFIYLVMPTFGWQTDWPMPEQLLYTAYAVGSAVIVLYCVLNPQRLVGRVLDHPIARAIGAASYSLYLWQQVFLGHVGVDRAVWEQFPLNIVLVCALGALSYHFIEKPLRRVRRRLT